MPVDQRRRRAPQVLLSFAAMLAALTACGTAPGSSAQPAGSSASADPSPGDSSASPGVAALGSMPALGRPSADPTSSASRKATGAPTAVANDAARLRTLPASTTQVIIVQAASASATTASLRAYAKSDGVWRPVLSAMTARIGGNGFSNDKREGDKTTPTGVYAFDATMYGIAADPGVRYSYHKLVQDDWWDENSASPGYNTFHHGANPGGPSEPLWQISPQYTYFAVIRYNMPATPGRGSGIFLHQATSGPTLGCVSLPQGDLVALLKWLDPAANPRIVLSPTGQLSRY